MPAKIDIDKCDGCGNCIDSCPTSAITIQDSHAVIAEEDCVDCAACVDECPHQAILCE